jgi:hypothetical protein
VDLSKLLPADQLKANKQYLANTIRSVDSHNKRWEEEKCWEQGQIQTGRRKIKTVPYSSGSKNQRNDSVATVQFSHGHYHTETDSTENAETAGMSLKDQRAFWAAKKQKSLEDAKNEQQSEETKQMPVASISDAMFSGSHNYSHARKKKRSRGSSSDPEQEGSSEPDSDSSNSSTERKRRKKELKAIIRRTQKKGHNGKYKKKDKKHKKEKKREKTKKNKH